MGFCRISEAQKRCGVGGLDPSQTPKKDVLGSQAETGSGKEEVSHRGHCCSEQSVCFAQDNGDRQLSLKKEARGVWGS